MLDDETTAVDRWAPARAYAEQLIAGRGEEAELAADPEEAAPRALWDG